MTWLPKAVLGSAMACEAMARVLWDLQEGELTRVQEGIRDVACPGCGVVHRGPGSLLRRGCRMRRLQTSSGRVRWVKLVEYLPPKDESFSDFPEALDAEDDELPF